MTIVIPLGTGSVLKDFELKMCLRSIEKNLSGYTNIVIIGRLPEWCQNVDYIPFIEDPRAPHDYNIMKKIEWACSVSGISEDFLFFNDDHFLLDSFEAKNIPYYYHSNLKEYVSKRGLDVYGKRANNTLQHLLKKHLPIKHFDIHTPIIYNKALFLSKVADLNWKEKTYIIKSLYANSLSIEGEETTDNKLTQPPKQPVKIFSTFPHMKASVTRYLTEQFPKKSKYEL